MKKSTILPILIIIILLTGSLLAACATSTPTPSSTLVGQTLMQQRCSVCHSLDRVTTVQKTADQWTITVQRMVARGAQLTTQEQQILIAYLAATY